MTSARCPRVPSHPRLASRGIIWVSLLVWASLLVASFAAGYGLATAHDWQAQARIGGLQLQAARLSERLASSEASRIRLERAHLVDREAKRIVQQQLALLQEERLRLAKQNRYLTGLIGEAGGGWVDIAELNLRKGPAVGAYRYRMTLTQVATELERIAGTVRVDAVLKVDSSSSALRLGDFPDLSPPTHSIDFSGFQTVEGAVTLPKQAKPTRLVVDVEFEDSGHPPAHFTFDWPGEEGADSRDYALRSLTDRPAATGER